MIFHVFHYSVAGNSKLLRQAFLAGDDPDEQGAKARFLAWLGGREPKIFRVQEFNESQMASFAVPYSVSDKLIPADRDRYLMTLEVRSAFQAAKTRHSETIIGDAGWPSEIG